MCLKLRVTSLLFTPYCDRKLCANGNSSFLSLSETFRSVKIFFLAFLKRSEAWKTFFWSFWNVQKHEKLLFGLSEMFRSMKNFHLVFLKRSEAWKTSFWSFWNVQKREKVSFGVSDVSRSAKKFHLVFLTRAEARKSFIWCFWREQKRKKAPFGVSETFRSAKNFIMNLCSALTAYCFFDNKPEALPVYAGKSKQLELFAYWPYPELAYEYVCSSLSLLHQSFFGCFLHFFLYLFLFHKKVLTLSPNSRNVYTNEKEFFKRCDF